MLRQLAGFLKESKKILASWDAYSEENTGLDGWPFDDDAYGLRQSQRDRETAEAFETVNASARRLLGIAETQLAQLPTRSVQNSWAWQLGTLRDALDHLDTLNEQWLRTSADLPLDARPGTPAFDDALAEHDAEAWSYLDDWATHGHALQDIHKAARHAPSALAPAPTATAAPCCGADRSAARHPTPSSSPIRPGKCPPRRSPPP